MINLNTKKIVIPYDFSETAGNAIRYAASIAALTKGELIIVFIQKKNEILDILLPSISVLKPSEVSEFLSEKLSDEAEKIEQKYGIKVTPVFSSGNISSEIINICNEMDANLIVMGTQGNDSNNDLFLGSNTYRTLTKSNLPILTVRAAPSNKGFLSILLPIDLSPHTKQKINIAIQLAKLFNGHIHVLGLFNESEQSDEIKLNNYVDLIEKDCVKNKVSVTSLITKTDNKVKRILMHSQKVNADVIISMTDQDTEFESEILGNYIHQLINNSTIPVLCVKPDFIEDNIINETNKVNYSNVI
jgi:nucleotide-binding universal stress UspA family protein